MNGVIPTMTNLIQQYQDKYSTMPLNRLLDFQDKLSTLSWTLAEQVGEAKHLYNGQHFVRKIEVIRKKQGLRTAKKITQKEAEEIALEETHDDYLEELELEANAYKMELMLRQCNRILSSVQQRISSLKQEKEHSRSINIT